MPPNHRFFGSCICCVFKYVALENAHSLTKNGARPKLVKLNFQYRVFTAYSTSDIVYEIPGAYVKISSALRLQDSSVHQNFYDVTTTIQIKFWHYFQQGSFWFGMEVLFQQNNSPDVKNAAAAATFVSSAVVTLANLMKILLVQSDC